MIKKEDYICTIPFTYTEVYDSAQYLCCPGWLGTSNNDGKSVYETDDIVKNFKSSAAIEFKKSILDGTYKYCNESVCPRLSALKKDEVSPFFVRKTTETLNTYREKETIDRINFTFDRSCNLKCPTCRIDFINATGIERDSVDKKLQLLIDSDFGGAHTLNLSGSAEPFFSKSFRNFLINFDKEKHKGIKKIHLQTNALLLNESMWLKLKNVHSLIHEIGISIDASTKDTYENKVRLGGNWDTLMSNLEFIATLELPFLYFSMVIQDTNFREMLGFHTMISNLMKSTNTCYKIYYSQINNWGHEPTDVFLERNVSDVNHINHIELVTELEKITNLPNVDHNFHHLFATKPQTLI
jgi:sulfatase maturation enzyme AslB (radical SAM superfamily)